MTRNTVNRAARDCVTCRCMCVCVCVCMCMCMCVCACVYVHVCMCAWRVGRESAETYEVIPGGTCYPNRSEEVLRLCAPDLAGLCAADLRSGGCAPCLQLAIIHVSTGNQIRSDQIRSDADLAEEVDDVQRGAQAAQHTLHHQQGQQQQAQQVDLVLALDKLCACVYMCVCTCCACCVWTCILACISACIMARSHPPLGLSRGGTRR